MKKSGGKSVLMLGCGGFIGSHLLDSLLAAGASGGCSTKYRVLGLDRASEKISHLVGKPGFEFRQVDIASARGLDALVKSHDTVVFLASLCTPALYNTRPLDVIDINFTYALPVVRSCVKHRKHLIHFSTCEVYGKSLAGFAPEGSAFREDPMHYVLSEDTSPLILGPVSRQRWTYSCAKQLLERVIYAEGAANSLAYTIVRPFNVIGPRMDFIPGVDGEGIPRVVPSFMKALMSGEALKLVNGGAARRSFIHVREGVAAVVRMIEAPDKSAGHIFNIGNPENEVTIAQLAKMMIDLFTRKTGKPPAQGTMNISARDFYGEGYDDCDRRVPDISKAESLLDWQPSIPLRQILDETMDWYLTHYAGRIRK